MKDEKCITEFRVELPANLPLVMGDVSWYVCAIAYLIVPKGKHAFTYEEPFSPSIVACHQMNDKFVRVSIWTGMKKGLSGLDLHPGGYLSLAKLIIERGGRDMIVKSVFNGIEYELSFPIWQENVTNNRPYVVKDENHQFSQLITFWNHESITHIGTVIGYTNIVLKKEAGGLSSTQEQTLKSVLDHVQKASVWWSIAQEHYSWHTT